MRLHLEFHFSFDTGAISEEIARKNTLYGAWNPDVTNVISTHGLVDPWRVMGIQEDINEQSPTLIIPGASHCNDLQAKNEKSDSRAMLQAREQITGLVKKWVAL